MDLLNGTPQDLTAIFVAIGSKQDVRNYTVFDLLMKITLNDSSDVEVMANFITDVSPTIEYPSTKEKRTTDGANEIVLNPKVFKEYDDNERTKMHFYVPDNAKKVQLYIKAGTLGATAGVIKEALLLRSRGSEQREEVDINVNFANGQNPTCATAETSTTELVPANPNRKGIFLSNIGVRDVYIAIGQDAILNCGILISKKGDVNSGLKFDAGLCSKEAINGITTGGTSDIMFQEFN